jgi:hypothetical protein
MATAEEIAALRLLIAEPNDAAPYTDLALATLLDNSSNEYAAAFEVWTQKAAGAAGLVDISEGGSSRKMGDLYEQYLSMAEGMRLRAISATQPPDGFGPGIRIRKLARP